MTSGARLLAGTAIAVVVACNGGAMPAGPAPTLAPTGAALTESPVSPETAATPIPTLRAAMATVPRAAPETVATPISTVRAATATVPPVSPTPTPRSTAAISTPTRSGPSVAAFASGIYYRLPRLQTPAGMLTLSGGQAVARIEMPPGGFSIQADRLVFSDNMSTLFLVSPDGAARAIPVRGLFRLARPSLSPDGDRVAVQASQTRDEQPENLDIFVVELNTGQWSKISRLAVNEESPAWFPASDRIAYSSFSPEEGVNLHIVDLKTGLETGFVSDGGAISVAISADEKWVLDPNRMRIYEVETGQVIADLRADAIAGLKAAGYEPDDRFPGQANRGTFPLDGGFSPDGRWIVFDGAVRRGADFGVVLAQIGVDGTGFQLLSDLIPTRPEFSNNHNYSQLNPRWLP